MNGHTGAGPTDQLRKAASLRGEVARLDRDELRARANRTWLGRRLRIVNALLTVALTGVLVADAWLAFEAFFGDSSSTAVEEYDEPYYSGLQILNDNGKFGGRITIVNPLDHDVEVLVGVTIYDGEQNVGEVLGSISMEADSESILVLEGRDEYVAYTESRVDFSGFAD